MRNWHAGVDFNPLTLDDTGENRDGESPGNAGNGGNAGTEEMVAATAAVTVEATTEIMGTAVMAITGAVTATADTLTAVTGK